MQETGVSLEPSQTFFVSQEKTHCPLAGTIIEFGKKLGESDEIDVELGCVSVGFGKRVVITGIGADFRELSLDDIVEIVDFDPIKRVMVVIGKIHPCSVAGLHWMIHHAREDIHAVCSLRWVNTVDACVDKVPVVEKPRSNSPFDQVKDVLRLLGEVKMLLYADDILLVVGVNLEEVEMTLQGLLR